MGKIALDKIRTDGKTQMRDKISDDVVEEYGEVYQDDAKRKKMPPLQVVFDGKDYWLWDGFHRLYGARKAGLKALECLVTRGSLKDARRLAAGANLTHGLRRSNKTKRTAVAVMLEDDPGMSDGAIAEWCGVSTAFVGIVRKDVSTINGLELPTVREGRDGRVRDTANIGRSEASDEEDSETADESTINGLESPSDDTGPDEGEEEASPTPPEDAETDPSESPPDAPAEPEEEEPVEVQTDAWDIPIQPHAAEAFAAVDQFKELVSVIQKAQRLFNDLANLPGGKFLTLPDVASYRRGKKDENGEYASRFVHEGLERAYQQVKAAMPAHTVCPWNYVEAPHPEDCPTCCGLNWTPTLGSNIPATAERKAREAHAHV